MKTSNTKQTFRTLGYLFFTIAALASSHNGKGNFNSYLLILPAILVLLLWLKIKAADIIIGTICSLISMYLILAITNDFVHHLQRSKIASSPLAYFGVGYSLSATALFLAIMIMVSTMKVVEKAPSKQPI